LASKSRIRNIMMMRSKPLISTILNNSLLTCLTVGSRNLMPLS
jgi:hypothetical protein